MANETESVVTIGHTTNGEEFLNTFIHELNHITTHIAKTLHKTWIVRILHILQVILQ